MESAQCMHERGMELSRWNETYSYWLYNIIEELHPYNVWKLHMIHAQKGHGYVRLLLDSVIFHQAGDTPYVSKSIDLIWLGKFGEFMVIHQICQHFPPYGIINLVRQCRTAI